jgi:ubiquinone/menaquinone biosynthesis C-methylase UbiE
MGTILSTSHLFQKYYYDREDFIDGTTAFHNFCASNAPPARTIVEIGAGPSNQTSDFYATLGPVCGLDVSDEVSGNSALNSWRIFDGKHMPFPDNSVDACFSNWVLEHVENPNEHFREVRRILRPGGSYSFRTMNAHHYVGAVSKFSPHWFHRAVANRVRALQDGAHDPWPTFYRCNTPKTLNRVVRDAGFRAVEIKMLETEPSYGRANAVLFYPMFLWERAVNASEIFSFLRAQILGSVTKLDN